MKSQKIPISQTTLQKEKQSWRNEAPWLKTILPSYSDQDIYGTSIKIEI